MLPFILFKQKDKNFKMCLNVFYLRNQSYGLYHPRLITRSGLMWFIRVNPNCGYLISLFISILYYIDLEFLLNLVIFFHILASISLPTSPFSIQITQIPLLSYESIRLPSLSFNLIDFRYLGFVSRSVSSIGVEMKMLEGIQTNGSWCGMRCKLTSRIIFWVMCWVFYR